MNVARSWPSTGQLAVTGDRWIMACGHWTYIEQYNVYSDYNSCEMLDTHAPTMKWTLIDNIPSSVCMNEMSAVGIHQNWIMMSGGYNM